MPSTNEPTPGPSRRPPRRKRYIRLPKLQRRIVSVLIGGYALLLVNSVLLLLFDRSTAMLYMSNVLLHVALGVLLVPPVLAFLVLHLKRMPLRRNLRATAVGTVTALSLLALLWTGVGLVVYGATAAEGALLVVHIVTAITTIGAFVAHVALKRGLKFHFLELGEGWRRHPSHALRHPLGLTLVAGGGLSLLFIAVPLLYGHQSTRPEGVYVESEGARAVPAAQAALAHGDFLDDADLSRSETCGQAGCHPDVFSQWQESVHRFSSFNNPYYRRSVEQIIERSGFEPARWCASCHDPAVLFTGRFEEGAFDADHWTAHEGITCLSCHAVEGLRDVKGNGRYVIDAPDEYPMARSDNAVGRFVHNRLIKAKPEPHRDAMMSPALRTQEFCGTCHKVGLPPEVNNYRWKRGQNEYDAWHASGASGNTVRSFYLPAEPTTCVSCHMPLVPSDDEGADGGLIRSHRFASANTALPYINGHPEQLALVQSSLSDSIATVDLFRVDVNGTTYGPDEPMPALRPGDEVRLMAVVRNRKVGHLLPGGTNDSNEMWLKLMGRTADGETVLASGRLDSLGRVDSTAHRWGAVLVDRDSKKIDKRNAQDWIATVYSNAIGPGTAHVVRYRFVVPPGPPITSFEARLQHRKFRWFFNEWTFRGEVAPGQAAALGRPEVDRRRWLLGSGDAPEIPITTMAAARRAVGAAPPAHRPLWERWNDFGIGLFLQGDTREALQAFARVSEVAPENPEGPVNEARVLIAEGQLDRATERLDEAERRRPGFLKAAYFRGEVLRRSGLYDEALDAWMRVYDAYPQDRVLLLGIGRLHYLSGRYEEALAWIDRVLTIDPESVGALYNRMLALGALGQEEAFAEARARYEFHKDDEDAQAVTAPYKQAHPMDNREAQDIHEHELWPTTDAEPMVAVRGLRAQAFPVRAVDGDE